MLLLGNALRNDLSNPNEFIRGRTLRLIAKLGACQILDTLVPIIEENLAHDHPYVRRNATAACLSILSDNSTAYMLGNISDKI